MANPQLLEKAKEIYTPTQVKKLSKAINFATRSHEGVKRETGDDYITHPLTVASYLIDWKMDLDSVIAGLLHDVIEDCDIKMSVIKDMFGEEVLRLVDGVTKLGKVRKGMNDIDSYLPQTRDNLAKLLIATGSDIRVIIIKLADRLHNLETLFALSPAKQRKIARESLDVFAPLADRMNMGRVRVQIEELSFSYLDPKRFNYLKKQMRKRLGRASKKLDKVREDVKKELKKSGIKFEMDGRVKSVYSLHKKLATHNQNFDAIYDLIALRIIVKDKATCYQVLGIIHSMYNPMLERIKDYIAQPKINGYQSIHTTVITGSEQVIEFQIRTPEMHEYAERGLAASFHYNEQKLTDAYKTGKIGKLPAELRWIAELQKAAGELKAGKKVDINKLKLQLFADKIFVYSPKGDIFELPKGSMPLDFAYRVHTDVGKKAHSFKVNGKIVKANIKLKTGDVVEVITSEKTKPTIGWLERVISSFARSKIKASLREEGTKVAPKPNQQKKKTRDTIKSNGKKNK